MIYEPRLRRGRSCEKSKAQEVVHTEALRQKSLASQGKKEGHCGWNVGNIQKYTRKDRRGRRGGQSVQSLVGRYKS